MITQVPSSYANAIAPFAPLGRQPVGQESTELKVSRFKPTEQSADAARTQNRRSPDERPNEIDEQERLREGRRRDSDNDEEKESRDDAREQEQDAERDLILELAARERALRALEHHHQSSSAEQGETASPRNIDINRRLMDIGALGSPPAVGRFIDKSA